MQKQEKAIMMKVICHVRFLFKNRASAFSTNDFKLNSIFIAMSTLEDR